MAGPARLPLLLLCLAGACAERVENLNPVGGQEASLAEQQRFVRRLYLDLTSRPPTDAELATATDRLVAEGNTAVTRRALAHDLIATDEFGETFVSELENRVFAGEQPSYRFNLICSIIRDDDPTCASCAPSADPCAGCACAPLTQLAAERASFLSAPEDLSAGATTGEIERRYGGSQVLRSSFGDGGALTDILFQSFLGRPAELDERRNGAGIVQGALLDPLNPAGVLFHRHGSNHGDLVDILFTSENYREAIVDRTFSRYLGRSATPSERGHFAKQLDDGSPDARAVFEAVLSSREYFDQ